MLGVKEDHVTALIAKAQLLQHHNPNLTNVVDQVEHPALWMSGLPLDCCLDTPMHQLFLGIVKSVIVFIATWLKSYKNMKHSSR